MAFYPSNLIREMVHRVNNDEATEEDYIKLASIPNECWRDFLQLEKVKKREGFFDIREDSPAFVSPDWINQIRMLAKKRQ